MSTATSTSGVSWSRRASRPRRERSPVDVRTPATSVVDDHYGGARPMPRRALRPKTIAEKASCALGPVAEAFLPRAAAAGHIRLGPELVELSALETAHGHDALLAALERATRFVRWRAVDVRSILLAGTGLPRPRSAGEPLQVDLAAAPVRCVFRSKPNTDSVEARRVLWRLRGY